MTRAWARALLGSAIVLAVTLGAGRPAWATILTSLDMFPLSPEAGSPAFFSCGGSTVTDGNGIPFTCAWNFGDPGAGGTNPNTASGINVQHTYTLSGGPFTVRVHICFDNRGCADASRTFSVLPACNPVVEPNGPYTGAVGEDINFAAKDSGCEDRGMYYVWDYGDGTGLNGNGTRDLGRKDKHPYRSPGTYTVKLQVFLGSVSKGQKSTTATISPANLPPTAAAGGPYHSLGTVPVTFDGSASSDPEGAALTYRWNFGDGTPEGQGARPTHAYASPGTYTVTLTVNDGRRDSAPSQATVTVHPPGILVPILELLFES